MVSLKIAIIGRTEILYDTVRQLVGAGHTITCIVTAKEAPEYTKTSADFNSLAVELGVPFACTSLIESQHELLKETFSDIAVSVNYSGVIPSSITSLFRFGILNSHGGDLPRYRGNACQAWAILNGEDRIGLCIHRMIGGELDSGDILAREFISIDNSTKVTQVWAWMNDRVPALFVDAVNKLSADPYYILESQSKCPGDALRCFPRIPEDGRVNWSESALQILRLINASNKPYQGAFCSLDGVKVILWDACLPPTEGQILAVPGQVVEINESYIDVACGCGVLRINSVEINGVEDVPSIWIKSIRKRFV